MFCFLRISVAGAPPRTVVLELRPDVCPVTCANFASLCKSPATAKRPPAAPSGRGPVAAAEPAYRGTEFHRIVPGFMIQGGDFANFDGTGGRAAPETNRGKPTFPDENFRLSHDREGVASMANRGKDTNGSQFFVTLGKAMHLDGKHVAFGSVARGMEVVREASRVETEGDRPARMQRVVIVDCGVGTGEDGGDDDSSASDGTGSSESSSSDDDERRRRRSGKKKRRRRDADDESRKHRKRSREKRSKSKKRRDDRDRKKKKKRRKDESSRRRHTRRSDSSSEDGGSMRPSKKKREKDGRSRSRRRERSESS
ncbi:hypothetical protein ACHAWF_002738 [Thalassiosira exigua]